MDWDNLGYFVARNLGLQSLYWICTEHVLSNATKQDKWMCPYRHNRKQNKYNNEILEKV